MSDKHEKPFELPPRPACIKPKGQGIEPAAPQGAGARSACPEAAGAELAPQGHARTTAPGRRPQRKPFNFFRSVLDEQSEAAPPPECAKPAAIGYRFFSSYHVPVSFAAKDWNVTPRRIRALLAAGRLAGQLQENGYWQVVFPYSFTFGTRGPALKRQQRQPDKPKNPERRAA